MCEESRVRQHILMFCPDCIDELEKKGGVLVSEYQSVCDMYVAYGVFVLSLPARGPENTILAELEKDGYIITTEYSQGDDHMQVVSVKPVGHESSNNEHMFCAHRKKHDH